MFILPVLLLTFLFVPGVWFRFRIWRRVMHWWLFVCGMDAMIFRYQFLENAENVVYCTKSTLILRKKRIKHESPIHPRIPGITSFHPTCYSAVTVCHCHCHHTHFHATSHCKTQRLMHNELTSPKNPALKEKRSSRS